MTAISVLMSVYNGEKYLKESVESILNQSFTDFEFIITDDCSTDGTIEILKEYSSKDKRIRLLLNQKNIGLTKSLNRMIDVSCGNFVARMDADDVSHVDRFQKQIQFMRSHPDVDICGTNVEIVDGDFNIKNRRFAFEHEVIKAAMLFNNAMPHSAVMVRSEVFKKYGYRYNEDFRIIQDYELWQRLIKSTKFYVLKDTLLRYRILGEGVTGSTSKNINYREAYLDKIYRMALNDLGIIPSEREIVLHRIVSNNTINYSFETLLECEAWLSKILNKNDDSYMYDKISLKKILGMYWFNLCTRSTRLGFRVFYRYITSGLFNINTQKAKNLSIFLAKCLIGYDGQSRRKT